MLAALDKSEDIIKDGVAPLVGREADPNESSTLDTIVSSMLLLTKRHITGSASDSSNTSQAAPSTVSKSTKSRGRPKVRKPQKMSEKKKRMSQGKHKASKLVQGTLVQVPNIHRMVNMLVKDYSNNDIQKKAQCEADIRYIFRNGLGRKRKSLSRTAENPYPIRAVMTVWACESLSLVLINSMVDRWYRAMASILVVEDTVTWAVNTSVNSITTPTEVLDGLHNAQCEREQKIKGMLLRGSRSTVFGKLQYQSLLTLRENLWIDDACMGYGLVLFQREYSVIGIIDPIFHRLPDRERKVQCGAFDTPNELVLLVLHVDNNHWCGVVFHFRSESKAITPFDPLQAGKSKYYQMSDYIL
ncbi:Cysteine protease [Phytophthora megakarya]|uniref:Cysteine protease n=1 Tax=Phytophthora megakarya TaxID=4795 RepID=A0A225VLG9_9STRA|nr:Cysteine protease [Phytophthora megakarya]